jgi:isopentenyl phosphate kinase
LKSDNDISLLKLGGSLLTDKNKPFSIRENVVESAIQQIIDANERLILIHGGGSFGHPLAKKYSISEGLNTSISDQILGLAETHQSMNKFNSYLINSFLQKKFPVISIQASNVFIKKEESFIIQSIDIIELFLDLGILPILYGDIILDSKGSFSIISGDQIIVELCNRIKNYNITNVIFAIEKDGLFIKERENDKLITKLALELEPEDLNKIEIAELEKKIDVTGGIAGKINEIKQICHYNIPVQIINGLKENFIFKALKKQNIISTKIKKEDNIA